MAGRLERLGRVTAELAAARDVETVTDIVVSHAADALGAAVASLSLLTADGTALSLTGMRGAQAGAAERWATYPLTAAVPAVEAVRTGRPVIVIGRRELEARYPDLAGQTPEERSVVCVPLRLGRESIGAIGLAFPGRRGPDERELAFLGAFADTCAQALDRMRALAAAQDAAVKLTFLAEASAELASSLDYPTTLARVARLAVPTLADWCAVEVLDGGRLRTLAVAHVDPAKVALAEELQRRYPSDPGAATGPANVVRTKVSEVYPEITDEMVVAGARDAEHLRVSRELGLRSALVVPLLARGRVLGALTFVTAESGRRYDSADLAFAEDLARRGAVAIDNANLYSDTHEAATRLQRAILPESPPAVPGWELAVDHRAAGRTELGGDFYDAVPLPGDRLAVVVGDVMGRGVHAAAAMAQMRAALRACIAANPAPQSVLTTLDRMFGLFDIAQLVTLVYVVLDPGRRLVETVSAGHPPPLLIRADQSVDQLPIGSTPVGIQPARRTSVLTPFDAGDTLLAYTDGLIERRSEDIDAGLRRLARHAPDLTTDPLGTALPRLVDAVHDQDLSDDVTAIAVRRQAPPAAGPPRRIDGTGTAS
jgi:GAF domain-containing protein